MKTYTFLKGRQDNKWCSLKKFDFSNRTKKMGWREYYVNWIIPISPKHGSYISSTSKLKSQNVVTRYCKSIVNIAICSYSKWVYVRVHVCMCIRYKFMFSKYIKCIYWRNLSQKKKKHLLKKFGIHDKH